LVPLVDPSSDEPSKKRGIEPTPMHGSQHAGDKPVDTPALLNERHERAYPAFIVDRLTEMGKNHPLERVYLVLQAHQI